MTFHSSPSLCALFYQVTIGPIYQLSRVGVLSYSILLSSHHVLLSTFLLCSPPDPICPQRKTYLTIHNHTRNMLSLYL